MKLTFLGTRGNIEARTRRHHMHSSLRVSYYGKGVMVDCGEDWHGKVGDLKLQAIVITHAHPDHAWGLTQGIRTPVFATEAAWEAIEAVDIKLRRIVVPRQPFRIADMTFEFFPVDHSTIAPAGGYRIAAGRPSIFYVPDVVYIPDRAAALDGIQVYVGDGATITRSMVRQVNGALVGHTPVRTQLTWCQKEDVPRAIFTHCGSEIVTGDERTLGPKVQALAKERGVEARIAYDGMEVILR